MKILLIGGPRFLGYALIETILAKNHIITMFNRGKTNPELFPQIERITGNRDGEINKLGSKTFDAVIDTCGYVPRIVKQSVDYLKNKTSCYIFISSISVYRDSRILNRTEDAELIELEDKKTEDIMGAPYNYGGLKVLCERAVQETFGNNAIIIRPGYIVGPRDPSHRFTYWSVRIRKGGKTLVPGDPANKMQIVDCRDLSEFIIQLIDRHKSGVYNVTGPNIPFLFLQLLEDIKIITKSNAEFYKADNKWMIDQKIESGKDLPLWDPSPEDQAMMEVSIARALQDGLKFRSLQETVLDTLKWFDSIQGETKKWPIGLNNEKEELLIKKIVNQSN